MRTLIKVAAVNAAILLGLLLVVELVFGNWIRPLGVADLKRFSIPIGVEYSYDVAPLYATAGGSPIRYTRDAWGLRGSRRTPADIDVLTVGGSTTDQKFLDDKQTWQAAIERELHDRGLPMTVANAGVDGQSTTGHLFDFQYWFPLLPGLEPKLILFYVGINDVMKTGGRGAYDGSLDASNWRVKSAVWQLVRLVRGTLSARNAQVVHGRKQQYTDADFSDVGMLDAATRDALSRDINAAFLADIDKLRDRSRALGATPVFMTQNAYGWNGGAGPARGIKQSKPVTVHGRAMNYADVSYLHQRLNAGLMEHCRTHGIICFDVANDVRLEADDYYDWLHTTPGGADKIGRYVAQQIAALPQARE